MLMVPAATQEGASHGLPAATSPLRAAHRHQTARCAAPFGLPARTHTHQYSHKRTLPRAARCPHHAHVQANRRGLITPGDRVVVSQCPRINERFSVMAEAGVVKILTIGQDGHTPDDPLVVTESGLLRCTSRHVFGSQDAVHDCSDLV